MPVVDPETGHLLVDGGHYLNFPTSLLKHHHGGHNTGINIGAARDKNFGLEQSHSALKAMLKFCMSYIKGDDVDAPLLFRVLTQLGHMKPEEEKIENPPEFYTLVIQANIQDVHFLDFNQMRSLIPVGFETTSAQLQAFKNSGQLKSDPSNQKYPPNEFVFWAPTNIFLDLLECLWNIIEFQLLSWDVQNSLAENIFFTLANVFGWICMIGSLERSGFIGLFFIKKAYTMTLGILIWILSLSFQCIIFVQRQVHRLY